MANPALKNGYISIANELVEKLSTLSIPSSEMRIVWVVWRKTWGWAEGTRKKDWDWISLSQFEKATEMKHGNVAKAVKSLVVKRILLKREKGLKFNQNYDEWVVCKRIPPVVKRILGGSQTHTKSGSQTHTNKRNKETNTKETSPKGEKKKIVHNSLGAEIIKSFEVVDPKNKKHYDNTTQRKACDYLLEEYGLERVVSAVKLLPEINQQNLYISQITTPYELMQNWVKLGNAYRKKKNVQEEKLSKVLW